MLDTLGSTSLELKPHTYSWRPASSFVSRISHLNATALCPSALFRHISNFSAFFPSLSPSIGTNHHVMMFGLTPFLSHLSTPVPAPVLMSPDFPVNLWSPSLTYQTNPPVGAHHTQSILWSSSPSARQTLIYITKFLISFGGKKPHTKHSTPEN